MKNIEVPYLLNGSSLITAVRQYLDVHISTDLDLMTEYIIETYDIFSKKNARSFKPSVKKAYEYVMKVGIHTAQSSEDKTTKPVKTTTPAMKDQITTASANPKAKAKKQPKDASMTSTKSTTPKQPLNKSIKKGIEDWMNDDCFVIDTVGDQGEECNSDEVTVITSGEGTIKLKTNTPASKKVSNETSTPTNPLLRKRKILDEDIERVIMEEKLKKRAAREIINKTIKKVHFSDLGGLEPIQESVVSVLQQLYNPEERPVTLLVSGPPACGKTALISAMVQKTQLPVLELPLANLLNSSPLNGLKKAQDELVLAFAAAPAVLHITQVDKLCSDSSGRNGDKELLLTSLRTALNQVEEHCAGQQLLVVVETSRVELLEQQLLDDVQHRIVIKPPTALQRTAILQKVLSRTRLSPDVELSSIGLSCSGYVAGDLVKLLKKAKLLARARSNINNAALTVSLDELKVDQLSSDSLSLLITQDDLLAATKLVSPVLKKEGFPAIPDTTWADVGGLNDIREELMTKVLDPIRGRDQYRLFNFTKNCSGILLWGPPGCGKTLLAKAVANEAGVNLLIVSGPELLHMYQGESERAVRRVFARAASVAPCVIFFDEFDALCPRRSKLGGESGSKATIVNTLLTEMNGFLGRPGVYVMAATNLPTVLDPAVLRPGRFDTRLYVGLPDLPSRVAVLNAATKHGTSPTLADDVDLEKVAGECEHFSGADCGYLVEMALNEAIAELNKTGTGAAGNINCMDTADISDPVPDTIAANTSTATVHDTVTGEKGHETQTLAFSNGAQSDSKEGSCSLEKMEVEDQEPCVVNRGAALAPASEAMAQLTPAGDEVDHRVYARHFQAALLKVTPSVSKKDRLQYEEQRRKEFL